MLYWLLSPYMCGVDKQWTVRGVFKMKNGKQRVLPVSWGALPMLKLGSIFVGGKYVRESDVAQEIHLDIALDATISVDDAAKGIKCALYPLRNYEYLNERTVVIKSGSDKIIIPCLEIIRSFFAINKTLANAILRPDSFTDICSASHDPAQGLVKLVFSKRYPYNAITSDIVSRIALFLFDERWSASWQRVWNNRNLRSSNDGEVVPLECFPPLFRGCSYMVRGIRKGDVVLVLEILGFTSNIEFPFQRIEYTHPRSAFGRKASNPKKHNHGSSSEEVLKINSSSAAPKGSTSPSKSISGLQLHSYLTKPKTEEVSVKSDQPWPLIVIVNKKGTYKRKDDNPSDSISLGDEAGDGDVQAAEFLPLVGQSSLPTEFNAFYQAVLRMTELVDNMQVFFKIGAVPEKSSLAMIGAIPRQYILICVVVGPYTAFILELNLSDKHNLSTVVFSCDGPLTCIGDITKELLCDCIINGSWDRSRINTVTGISYELAKHRKSDALMRGARLLVKIRAVLTKFDASH